MSLSYPVNGGAAPREWAARALKMQLGLANPLWLGFGAAASAGAAWWLMTRWAFPVTVEATTKPEMVEALESAVPLVEPVTEAVVEVTTAPATDDDLTRLIGVGLRTAKALNDHGVRTFAQLAAWTTEDLAAFDAALKLKGRGLRDKWLDQARVLAAQA